MQGLDSTAQHLGDLGELLDGRCVDPALAQELRRPAAGDELDVELGETARELLEAGLVPDRKQRPLDQEMSSLTV
jgi:hypothetical protein